MESDERKVWDEMAAEGYHKASENERLEKDLRHSVRQNFKNEKIISWLNGSFGTLRIFSYKRLMP